MGRLRPEAVVGVVPAHELRERVARLLCARGIEWRRVHGGYTPAERWVVQLDDGRSAFVKAAVDELTGGWLRAEALVYQAVHASFMPALLGWSWDCLSPADHAIEIGA